MKKVIAGLTALSMLAFATPAFADMNSSSIKIEVENNGKIYNDTTASAKTGGNYAGGSTGGNGGSGGEVESNGYHADMNNGAAKAGNGGNGGNASAGGLVVTGEANADAGTFNKLNGTEVDLGGRHGDMNSSRVYVEVENGDDCGCSVIDNETDAYAKTGDNTAKGSRGGKGGRGGDVEASGDNNNGGATSGHGGAGGAGAIGGEVRSGAATSNAGAVNVMNTTIVRVRN